MRVATWHVELSRDGPGLLLRDLLSGDDEQVAAVHGVIGAVAPDILLLTGVDIDPGNATLEVLRQSLSTDAHAFPHAFAFPSNAGLPTDLDLDGDGRLGTPRDAQGYGRFRGDGAMALLSAFPIDHAAARDFSGLLWRDLPGATLPQHAEGTAFPSDAAMTVQRLSSAGHWVVPIDLPSGGSVTILAYTATPPVFDGLEDRNGLRAADETRLWQVLLDGDLGPPPEAPFVLLGRANVDPADGEGRREALRDLLADPRLQDPKPGSEGGQEAGDATHVGDPALDTAAWSAPPDGPGNLRVDYVLPSVDLDVIASGVHWPSGAEGNADAASRGRLVWVDIALPPPARAD